jgi:predicted acyltransferase
VNNNNTRWDALDVLRGLTILLMLMNVTPGSWETNFAFLVHAKWQGWTLIDMVAPAFLFCIGCAMPLSFERRSSKGATRGDLLRHVVTRGLLLVAIGFCLNLYPKFDFETVRIPGVLQRIGLCYAIAGAFALLTARVDAAGTLRLRGTPILWASGVVLVSYWALLYFVPAPGFEKPSVGPIDSWPSVIDRAVIGVAHLFPHWPIDGKVVFDPEGLLSTWPACFNVLAGTLVGIVFARGALERPALAAIVAGALTMGVAYALVAVCPMIKNLWTSTFALFSAGFALVLLGVLMPVTTRNGVRQALWPARIFGENPLLAYILVFLMAPMIDANLFGSTDAPVSIRSGGQSWLSGFLDPRVASLTFALACMALLFAILLVCHRRRWILKL